MQHKRFKKSTYLMRPVNVVSQSGTTVNSYTELPGTHADKFWYAPVIDRSAFELSGFALNRDYLIGTCSGSPPNPIRITNLNNTFEKIVDLFGQSKFYNGVLGNAKGSGDKLIADASRCQDLINIIINRFGGEVDLSCDGTNLRPQIYVPDTNSCYEYFGNLRISHTGNYAAWCLPFYLNTAGETTYYFCVAVFNAYGTERNFSVNFISNNSVTPYYPRDNGEVEIRSSNPYPNIPNSEPGGGDGPGIGGSDVNPVPPLPSISAVGSGMCRLYNPTVSQLIDLGTWLWGNGLDLTQLKKIFQDPMDIILGCSIFPVAMPGETTEHIMFGNLDSEVSAKVVSSQYTTRDLGTIEIPETYNSYLDYSPYTKIQLYLPYIGMKQLNTDEVMGKTLGVVYSIDLLSGACVAHVYVESQLMYEFGGTCNTQIPLTARDYTATVQSVLGILGGSAAIGVAAAMLPETIPAVVGAGSVVGGLVMNAAKNTIASKPTVEHASGIGGSTGIMASQHAYVIMEVPNLCHPPNQEHFTGYPGFIYGKISDFEGYTKFINFEFINIHATEPELQELQDWFMNKGVRI